MGTKKTDKRTTKKNTVKKKIIVNKKKDNEDDRKKKIILLLLLRYKPIELISFARISSLTVLISNAVGYFSKSAGVTMFTRTSVDCADKMVATNNSNGVVKRSPEPILP